MVLKISYFNSKILKNSNTVPFYFVLLDVKNCMVKIWQLMSFDVCNYLGKREHRKSQKKPGQNVSTSQTCGGAQSNHASSQAGQNSQ